MGAQTAGVTFRIDAEENKNPQRQAPAISRQIGDNSVAELFAADAPTTTEEHQQTGKVDR